jgi:hypothetical protein
MRRTNEQRRIVRSVRGMPMGGVRPLAPLRRLGVATLMWPQLLHKNTDSITTPTFLSLDAGIRRYTFTDYTAGVRGSADDPGTL